MTWNLTSSSHPASFAVATVWSFCRNALATIIAVWLTRAVSFLTAFTCLRYANRREERRGEERRGENILVRTNALGPVVQRRLRLIEGWV